MHTLQEVADVLRSHLQASSMTQEALRREVGISRQTVTNVLSGSQDYRVTTLLAMCDRLGLELALVPKVLGDSIRAEPGTPVVRSLVQVALDRVGTTGHGRSE